MRVVDLAEFYSERGGGVRSYLDRFLLAFDALGHEAMVVAPGPRDEVTHVGRRSRIVRYRGPALPYDATYHAPLRLDRARAIVRELRPDVLQVSSPFAPAWIAATLPDVPLRTYVYHSDPINTFVRKVSQPLGAAVRRAALGTAWKYMRATCNTFDATIVAGRWLERELVSHGCERVVTVPFGIQHDDFGPERADAQYRAELLGPLAADPRSRLLLIAGRLSFDKRQAPLLEAVERVARRRAVGVVLLGDGPESKKLEALGARLPRFVRLPFLRDRSEYAKLLASCDALVHGSVAETFGFVLVEALASGTPIVVPAAGAALDLADPAASELYHPDAPPLQIAAAIERLLARPLAELRTAAIERARSVPSGSAHFESLARFYEKELSKVRLRQVA